MELSLADLQQAGSNGFPGLLGVEWQEASDGYMRAAIAIEEKHLSPNGYLHAGTVVGLADSTCGYGCFLNLPDGAQGFTTIELKANFLRTTLSGTITCEARLAHGGRTTQLWDATVTDAEAKAMALFRCTQLVLR